jgi:hypothetical protein
VVACAGFTLASSMGKSEMGTPSGVPAQIRLAPLGQSE